MSQHNFTSKLSSSGRKKMSSKKNQPSSSKEKSNDLSQSLFTQGSKDQVFTTSETQTQGSKDQASKLLMQGSKDQVSDFKIPPSGTCTRSDTPTPPPSPGKLSKVTHSFVYELVKEVVSKFVTLAILEETLAKYQKHGLRPNPNF